AADRPRSRDPGAAFGGRSPSAVGVSGPVWHCGPRLGRRERLTSWQRRRFTTMRTTIIILLLAAIGGGAFYYTKYLRAEAPPNLRTAEVERGELLVTISATG